MTTKHVKYIKTLSVDYTMELAFSDMVTDHYFILRCIPTARGCQTVTSRALEVIPSVPLYTYRDTFGNFVYRGQCCAPHDRFAFHVNALVQVHSAEGTREPCPPFYKYPTPLTRCTDDMDAFLRIAVCDTEFAPFVQKRHFERAQIKAFARLLCSVVHQRIVYTSGATTVKTTAQEAFATQKGVCQDYAHLFIALCRQAGVAARYVCGMSKGEGATHAWAEYFIPDDDESGGDGCAVQGTWFGIDPTRDKAVDDDYVILAVGRDFTDSQIDRGVFCGAVTQTQSVLVKTTDFFITDNMGEFSGHSVADGVDVAGQQQ